MTKTQHSRCIFIFSQTLQNQLYIITIDPLGESVQGVITILEVTNMKESKIKVLMVEPGKHPKETDLINELDALQKAVSIGAEYQGLLEIIPLGDNFCLLCNEEGKLLCLEGNRRVGRDIIAGVFYICKEDEEGNLCSLSEDEMEQFKKRFWEIEEYTQQDVDEAMFLSFFFH